MTDSGDPYARQAAPQDPIVDNGNLEDAVAGNYQLEIGEVLSASWEGIAGNKGVLLLGMLILIVASIVLTQLQAFAGLDGTPMIERGELLQGMMVSILTGLLATPITGPLTAGLMLLAVKRFSGERVGVGEIFAPFDKVVNITITAIAVSFATYLGFLLFLIPGIYLGVALSFSVLLVADKGLDPVSAMTTSLKAVTHKWFVIFFAFLALGLLMVVSAIPMGIGLIWTLPMLYMAFAFLYRRIFGYTKAESVG